MILLAVFSCLLWLPYFVECQCSEFNKRATEAVNVTSTLTYFTTPGWKVAYYSAMDCKWILDAGRDDVIIVIDIMELYTEYAARCLYDSFAVYRDETATSEVVKLCGTLSFGRYVTVSGRYATLRMKSDFSRQLAGVSLRFFYTKENTEGSCSGTTPALTATSSEQFITSPGFPLSLSTGIECTWKIEAFQTTGTLFLEIIFTDLERIEDMCFTHFLYIYDGDSDSAPLLKSMCDSRIDFPTSNMAIHTTGRYAFVKLVIDIESDDTYHGFTLLYRQNSTATVQTTTTTLATTTVNTDVCSDLDVVGTWREFTSVNYPLEYVNNIDCTWRLEAEVGSVINLTFTDSYLEDTEGCSADAITVYDGQSTAAPIIASFCGETPAPDILSTGRFLLVHMRTDGARTYRGFSAKYKAESSGFTVNFSDRTEIILRAEVGPEEKGQAMAEGAGASGVGENWEPRQLDAKAREPETENGAETPSCVNETVTQNLTATTEYQYFTSTGYPDYYNNSITLFWLIQNPNETETLAIEVEDSRIEGSVGCKYDSVTVYQGPCSSYPLLGQFCGVDRPKYYQSTGPYALLVFSTDRSVTFRGFKIKYYLTRLSDDGLSIFIIAGIIAGSVLGTAALGGLIGFGVYKYLQYRKGQLSGDRKRLGSMSSISSESSRSSSDNDVTSTRVASSSIAQASPALRPGVLPSIREK